MSSWPAIERGSGGWTSSSAATARYRFCGSGRKTRRFPSCGGGGGSRPPPSRGGGGRPRDEAGPPRSRGSACPRTLADRPPLRASWRHRAGAMKDEKSKNQRRWAVASLLLLMTVACDQATKHVAAASFIDVIPYTL